MNIERTSPSPSSRLDGIAAEQTDTDSTAQRTAAERANSSMPIWHSCLSLCIYEEECTAAVAPACPASPPCRRRRINRWPRWRCSSVVPSPPPPRSSRTWTAAAARANPASAAASDTRQAGRPVVRPLSRSLFSNGLTHSVDACGLGDSPALSATTTGRKRGRARAVSPIATALSRGD